MHNLSRSAFSLINWSTSLYFIQADLAGFSLSLLGYGSAHRQLAMLTLLTISLYSIHISCPPSHFQMLPVGTNVDPGLSCPKWPAGGVQIYPGPNCPNQPPRMPLLISHRKKRRKLALDYEKLILYCRKRWCLWGLLLEGPRHWSSCS